MLQLEPSTYGHGFILEVLYIVGFTLIALIINRSGKFPLLCKKATEIIYNHLNLPINTFSFQIRSHRDGELWHLRHSGCVRYIAASGSLSVHVAAVSWYYCANSNCCNS